MSDPIGVYPQCCGYYGEGSGPILVSSVSCSGSEEDISSCSHSHFTTYDHQYDVGVQCQQGYILYMNECLSP